MRNKSILSPQEAFEYIIFTHKVEGIEFTDEEKTEIINDLEKMAVKK